MDIPVSFSEESSLIPRIGSRIQLSKIKKIKEESVRDYFTRIAPVGYWGYLSVKLEAQEFKISKEPPNLILHDGYFNWEASKEESWWVRTNLKSKEFPELLSYDLPTDKILAIYNIVAMGITPFYVNLIYIPTDNLVDILTETLAVRFLAGKHIHIEYSDKNPAKLLLFEYLCCWIAGIPELHYWNLNKNDEELVKVIEFLNETSKSGEFKSVHDKLVKELDIDSLFEFSRNDRLRIKTERKKKKLIEMPTSSIKTKKIEEMPIKGAWKWYSDAGWIDYPADIQALLNRTINQDVNEAIIQLGPTKYKIIKKEKGWIQQSLANPKIYRKVMAPM